ncbi:MAG: endonuclease/exonuclease/phosphatase family protein [Pseudomonadota bacterium]
MRIATYNVQNLFVGPGGAIDRGRASIKALRRMLELLDADVLALQEVGGQAALERLNEDLAAPYPLVRCVTGNSDRGIHLAFLSRIPLNLTSHRSLRLDDEDGRTLQDFASAEAASAGRLTPLGFQRDALLAQLKLSSGAMLAIVNLHLKSRATAAWRRLSSDAMRAAEIRAAASLAEGLAATGPAMLVGDFNETASSDLMHPIARLGWIDAMRWETGRARGAAARPPGTYWKKRHTRLDYLLLSADLESSIEPGSARTLSGALGQRASDHYPVCVDLALEPAERC